MKSWQVIVQSLILKSEVAAKPHQPHCTFLCMAFNNSSTFFHSFRNYYARPRLCKFLENNLFCKFPSRIPQVITITALQHCWLYMWQSWSISFLTDRLTDLRANSSAIDDHLWDLSRRSSDHLISGFLIDRVVCQSLLLSSWAGLSSVTIMKNSSASEKAEPDSLSLSLSVCVAIKLYSLALQICVGN